MKKLLATVLILGSAVTLAACDTVGTSGTHTHASGEVHHNHDGHTHRATPTRTERTYHKSHSK